MYKSQCMINSMILYSFEDNAGISLLAHALLSLLFFNHGFIQIPFGVFAFFFIFAL